MRAALLPNTRPESRCAMTRFLLQLMCAACCAGCAPSTAHSERADLHLVLGSSLRVTPAADMPARTAERGRDLVVVNLQTTPHDSAASLVIRARTDVVMQGLMAELGASERASERACVTVVVRSGADACAPCP